MVASAGANPLPGILLACGLVTIVVTTVGLLAVVMQQRTTKAWATVDPLYDDSYGATFRRTMYRAYRVSALKYAMVAGYGSGLALLIASGLAKVFG